MSFARRVTLALFMATLATSLTGCLNAALQRRAAYDFSCPEEQLVITDLDHLTSGVEGCGRKATYVWNGETWLMNTDVEERPVAAPAVDEAPAIDPATP